MDGTGIRVKQKKRIIVGISGASGAPVAVEVLKALKKSDLEIHLVISDGARRTIETETGMPCSQVEALADVVHDNYNIGASIASGSYRTMGMIVVPCSMKTLAGINCGYSDNLLLRAADVVLKERRKLVLAVRECPLSSVHLKNMLELSQAGAVILPLMLSYYNQPETLQDATGHIAGKILDQFDLEYEPFRRWEG